MAFVLLFIEMASMLRVVQEYIDMISFVSVRVSYLSDR